MCFKQVRVYDSTSCKTSLVEIFFNLVTVIVSVFDLVTPIRMFEHEISRSASSQSYTLDLLRCKTMSHSNSFIPHSASLWNSWHGACFSPSYKLDCFFKEEYDSYPQPLLLSYFSHLIVLSSWSPLYQEWLLLVLFGAHLHKQNVKKFIDKYDFKNKNVIFTSRSPFLTNYINSVFFSLYLQRYTTEAPILDR